MTPSTDCAQLISEVYKTLYDSYGPQGWWPILSLHGKKEGTNPTKAGSVNGYHVGNYDYPKTKDQMFEICLGAILTQNTGWPSVEKALLNLKRSNALKLKDLKRLSEGKLKELIKPAGYYNQKANYIREFTKFFEQLTADESPSRDSILAVKGVGPETADSILLFAFRIPEFIVDAYTKRIFSRLGVISPKDSYDSVKGTFESALKKDLVTYQEYHALIVEHAKRHCTSKPSCEGCPISDVCQKKHL